MPRASTDITGLTNSGGEVLGNDADSRDNESAMKSSASSTYWGKEVKTNGFIRDLFAIVCDAAYLGSYQVYHRLSVRVQRYDQHVASQRIGLVKL